MRTRVATASGSARRGRRWPGARTPSGGRVMQRRRGRRRRRSGRGRRWPRAAVSAATGVVYDSRPAASSVTPGRRQQRGQDAGAESIGGPSERPSLAGSRRRRPRTSGTGTLRATMWPRLSIVAGLVAGIAVAVVVLGGIVAFAPDPAPTATPVADRRRPTAAPPPSAAAAPSARPERLAVGRPRPGVGRGAVPHRRAGPAARRAPGRRRRRSTWPTCAAQPVWVNFMGTYCPPCVDEFPLMNGFAARYADDGPGRPGHRRQGGGGRRGGLRRGARGDLPARPRRRRERGRARGTRSPCRSTSGSTRDGIIRDGALGGHRPGHHGRRGSRRSCPDVDRHARESGRRRGGRVGVRVRRAARPRRDLVAAPAPLLVVVDFDGTLADRLARPGRRPHRRHRPSARCGAWPRSAGDGHPGRCVAVLTGRTVADVADGCGSAGSSTSATTGCSRRLLARGGARGHRCVATDGRALRAPSRPGRGPREPGSPTSSAIRRGCSSSARARRSRSMSARPTTSRRPRAARRRRDRRVERAHGLRDHGLAHYRGRSVVDLRPVDAGGKREAVERLIGRHRPGALVALGDELSDVDAFEAVRRGARRRIRRLVGRTSRSMARIGRRRTSCSRSPTATLRSARDVGPWLAALARALRGSTGG